MNSRVYLDYNATSPLRPEAREAMLSALDSVGNPSSIHSEGRVARAIVEDARAVVASAIGATPSQVFFTSGGTESANTVLSGGDVKAILATEHACVRDCALTAAEIAVKPDGVLAEDLLRAALATDSPSAKTIVAIQAANNETGVLQSMKRVVELAHSAEAVVLCDAVQMLAREDFDVSELDVDMAFLSAHKFGGPKGVGALYLKRGLDGMTPLIRGGGQERRVRSGTENVAGIAGMAAALHRAMADRAAFKEKAAGWQTAIEDGVRMFAPDATIFGHDAPRLSNTTCFAVPGLRAEMLLIAFDLAGVAVSSGAACSSGKVERSHVLAAMGVAPDLNQCAIRISTGWKTVDNDVGRFLEVFETMCARRPVSRSVNR